MNDDSKLDSALHDRLNIIELLTYSKDEMVENMKLQSLPKILCDKGVLVNDVTISDEGAKALLVELGGEIKNLDLGQLKKVLLILCPN